MVKIMSDQVQDEEDQSKFVKLLNATVKKVKEMKHVDAKWALEVLIFPLFSSFYREFDDEMENVLQKIDVEDEVVDAIADSPEFIQETVRYVSWVGTTFDRVFQMAGFIATDPNDPKKAAFTNKATDEVKKIFQEVGANNVAMLQRLKQLEESLAADDDDGDDDEGEPDGDVAVEQSSSVSSPATVAPTVPPTMEPVTESVATLSSLATESDAAAPVVKV